MGRLGCPHAKQRRLFAVMISMHNMKLSSLQGGMQEGIYPWCTWGWAIHMPVCTDQPKLRSLSHDFVGARNAGSSLACPIYQGSISCHMAYWSSHVCVCVCVCAQEHMGKNKESLSSGGHSLAHSLSGEHMAPSISMSDSRDPSHTQCFCASSTSDILAVSWTLEPSSIPPTLYMYVCWCVCRCVHCLLVVLFDIVCVYVRMYVLVTTLRDPID